MSILKAENISKQYRLGLVGTGTMNHDLKRWWHLVRGKEDPFLKIGEANDRSTKGKSDYVWALRDINFEVKQGEVLGVIGKNGAGKSTLLKILSRVTSPTTGEIKTKGRIASLLEVGTGFHPEMTGRENIYLNGTILGMTKAEIQHKEAEIIAFSGCERYIDTPVKRYSSGMTVRLAFAVAAHLEPDILVVDEVLAVGDAEFQKKAVGKMQDISQGEGRTVLFVSHNMAAVKSLCTRAMVLEHGKTAFEGETDKAIYHYLEKNIPKIDSVEISNLSREGLGNILLNKIIIANESQIMTGKELKINLVFEIYKKGVIPNRIGITMSNKAGVKIININTSLTKKTINFHKTEYSCLIPNLPLVEGNYRISVAVFSVYGLEDYLEEIKGFYVNGYDFYGNGKTVDAKYGIVVLNHEWN